MGGAGGAEFVEVEEEFSRTAYPLFQVIGPIEVGVIEQSLPSEAGSGLFDKDPHDEEKALIDLILELLDFFSVFERFALVMN